MVFCLICGKEYQWKSQLEIHMRRHRSQVRRQPDWELSSKSNSRRHKKIASVHTCHHCCKTFNSSSALKTHLKTVLHLLKAPPKEDECGTAASTETVNNNEDDISVPTRLPDSQAVINEEDTIQTSHYCITCCKTFKTHSALKAHLKTLLHLLNDKSRGDCETHLLVQKLSTVS
jgi:hypothetical protein